MDRNATLIKQLKGFKVSASRDIPIERMYLFGSRTSGRVHRDSDVDLVIVSPAFKRLNFFQRGGKMYEHWKLRLPVDFLCYTPEEYERLKKRISIVREAVEHGIAI